MPANRSLPGKFGISCRPIEVLTASCPAHATSSSRGDLSSYYWQRAHATSSPRGSLELLLTMRPRDGSITQLQKGRCGATVRLGSLFRLLDGHVRLSALLLRHRGPVEEIPLLQKFLASKHWGRFQDHISAEAVEHTLDLPVLPYKPTLLTRTAIFSELSLRVAPWL